MLHKEYEKTQSDIYLSIDCDLVIVIWGEHNFIKEIGADPNSVYVLD